MPYKLVGRIHSFEGKRLWEIIGNLKNFGEGRMVVRNVFDKRYPEPTFYRIVMARPEMDTGRPHMDEDNMRGTVLMEKVFRGRHCGVMNMSKVAYKTDYKLIPKHEETKYIEAFKKCETSDVRIIDPHLNMPPLLKLVAERDGHTSKVLKVKLNKMNQNIRIAKEGEVPTEKIDISIGKPLSPELYVGVL